MTFQKFVSELKKRNVHRVATVYAVTGWLIIQIIATINEPLNLPDKIDTVTIILVAIGFPIALIIAWVFELTPTGIQKTNDTEVSEGFNDLTKRKLNRLTIVILLLVLSLMVMERIFLVGSGFYTNSDLSKVVDTEKSVIVLPFLDISPEKDQEWFSDGLTDELLNSLSRVPELRVIARTTSFALKAKELSVQKIADSLNVNYLVEGSVRKAGDKIKVTAQLIDPRLDAHIWSNTFEKEFVDIFDIQQAIAEGISRALNIYFNDEMKSEMFSSGTKNADAYEAYLRGNELFNLAHSREEPGDLILLLDSANNFYQEATRLDPGFAAVYYKHQDVYMHYLIHSPKSRPQNLTETQVFDIIKQDIANARKLAKSRGEEIFYELENATISNDWSRVPMLFDELFNNKEYLNEVSRLGLGWTNGLFIVLDREEIGLEILKENLKSDPLNRETMSYIYRYLTAQNRLDTAQLLYRKDHLNERDLLWEIFNLPEKTDEIISVIPTEKMTYELLFAQLISDTIEPELFARITSSNSSMKDYYFSSLCYAARGNQQKADSIASIIDASFLGPTKLSDYLLFSYGKIPFRLSATPNFSARLKEAGISDLVAYEKEHFLTFGR